MYTIKFTDDGLQDAKNLPKNIKNSMKRQIKDKLANDPYQCSWELNAPLEGFRSCRLGKYRVVFKVYDDLKVVAIAGIGKRLPQSSLDIYEKLEALMAQGKLAEKIMIALRGFSSPPKR